MEKKLFDREICPKADFPPSSQRHLPTSQQNGTLTPRVAFFVTVSYGTVKPYPLCHRGHKNPEDTEDMPHREL